MLEERIALMEGAEACRVQATGMAAMTTAMLSALKTGDHVVGASAAFGSCRWLLRQRCCRASASRRPSSTGATTMPREKAIRPNTKIFFFETPANPTMDIVDIRHVCSLARAHGILSVVDNAFATPVLQRPLEFGADVVAYSATKMMDGQGRVLAGAVCGTSQWINDVLLPFQRNTGPNCSPFNAWVVLKGLETLELRRLPAVRERAQGRQICRDARQARASPGPSPAIHSIIWPASQMSAAGPIFAFIVDGGRQQAMGLLNALELIDISNNIGDSRLAADASRDHDSSPIWARKVAPRRVSRTACCGSMWASKTPKTSSPISIRH